MATEEIFDSPVGNVKSHIRSYVESDGRKGHIWQGMPTLLLITRGRKTGKLRRVALIYGRHEGVYLLVASHRGSAKHPLWYLNLAANPEVEIQVGADRFEGRARTATPEEKERLWGLMVKILPYYQRYQEKAGKAGREIPLVIVEPVG